MKPSNAIAFAAALAIVSSGATWWWMHRSSSSPTEVSVASQQERKVLYWHDPMVPNQKFDKPGKSPFMDMQLVPVYADEGKNAGVVSVNSNVIQNLGIRLAKVQKETVQSRLAAVGSIAFDEHRVQLIQARVNGYISKLHIKAPLDRVHKAEALAEIVAPDWLQAQQEYAALLASTGANTAEIKAAARQRLIVLGVPDSTIAALEQGQVVAPTTTIYSPIDGVVTELGVREGAAFMTGATLFRINGLGSVWANVQIPEAQRHLIPIGSTVTARATGWPGLKFAGRAAAILPDVDVGTRTLTVRAVLDNPGEKLSPGMFVTLDLDAQASEPQLVVPSEAIIMTGQRTVVMLAHDDGSFDAVNVTVGAEAEGKTVVLSGLEEGQSIVVSGQFLIDSEASLTATIDRLKTTAARP